MSTPFLLQDNDRLIDITFSSSETVNNFFTRYFRENCIPGSISDYTFTCGKTELSHYLYSPMSNFVKRGKLVIMKEKTDSERGGPHDYTEECIGFTDISKNKKTLRGFSTDAPKWRTVDKGLNIFGRCKCKKCEAHNQTVVVMKGGCTFDLIKEGFDLECPECGSTIEPITVGYYLCKYKMYGKKVENGMEQSFSEVTGETRDKDHCEYFDPELNEKANFTELVFEITEIF